MKLMKLLWLRCSDEIFDKNNLGSNESMVIKHIVILWGLWTGLYECWELSTLYDTPLCYFTTDLNFVVLLLPCTPREEKNNCMSRKETTTKTTYSAYFCSTANYRFAWLSDVEMSQHQSNLKLQTSAYYYACFHYTTSFPPDRYYNSLYAFLTFLISCKFIYSTHLNIVVNKLVSVMFKFAVLHG